MVFKNQAVPVPAKPAKIALNGSPGSSKTVTAGVMTLALMSRLAGEPNSGLHDHFGGHGGPGPQGAAGGFRLRRISPLLNKVIGDLSTRRFPAKTLPDAVGPAGEMAAFDWQDTAWELISQPGETLWLNGGIDVDEVVREFRKNDVLVLTFAAPVLNTPLGVKFVQGLTATYQLAQLGHGFVSAVESSVKLALSISPEGFRTELALEHQVIAEHEGSTLRWVPTAGSGRFQLNAVRKGKPVPAEPVFTAIKNVVEYAVRKNLGNIQVRNALPFLNDRAVTALTFTDLADQFVPAVTRDDWDKAFTQLWGGVDRNRCQEVLLPNVAMELQPVGTTVPGVDAAGKAVQVPVAATIRDLNLAGAEKLWNSINHILGRRRSNGPALAAPPEPTPAPVRKGWRLFNRGGRPAVPSTNGKH